MKKLNEKLMSINEERLDLLSLIRAVDEKIGNGFNTKTYNGIKLQLMKKLDKVTLKEKDIMTKKEELRVIKYDEIVEKIDFLKEQIAQLEEEKEVI